MIVVPGPLDPPANRLLAALAARGVPMLAAGEVPPDADPVTLAVSTGPFEFDFAATAAALGRPFRVLALSRLGAHPDATAPALAKLWRLEELVRGGGAPTLTLRFAPLVGEGAPLWEKLRARPKLPREGRHLLQPVLESDAVETLVHALADDAPWNGWYEVAGPEVWSLAELRDLASATGRGREAGAWAPSLAEMAEHRLAESEPWQRRFGIAPASVGAFARERVA